MTPNELATLILGELGDSTESIWTRSEILDYMKSALYDFKARGLCSWQRLPLNNILGQAVYTIPSAYNFFQLERAEYDYWAVSQTPPRVVMSGNGYFETSANRPLGLLMEGDGLGVIRKIGVPVDEDGVDFAFRPPGIGEDGGGTGTPWNNPSFILADDGSESSCNTLASNDLIARDFGFDAPTGEIQSVPVKVQCRTSTGTVSVSVSLVSGTTVLASQQILVTTTETVFDVVFTPTHWGSFFLDADVLNASDFKVVLSFLATPAPIRVNVDYVQAAYSTSKFIIEFYDIGVDPNAAPDSDIDLPDRYLVYIAHRVKSDAYNRDGDGQSKKMSNFWLSLYEDGVEMVLRRRERIHRRRISNIGNDGKVPESSRHRDPGTLPAYFPKVE